MTLDQHELDLLDAYWRDTPTLEVMAATAILREQLPELTVRVVNVMDLMRLQPHTEHPHGMTDGEFDALCSRVGSVNTSRPSGQTRRPGSGFSGYGCRTTPTWWEEPRSPHRAPPCGHWCSRPGRTWRSPDRFAR